MPPKRSASAAETPTTKANKKTKFDKRKATTRARARSTSTPVLTPSPPAVSGGSSRRAVVDTEGQEATMHADGEPLDMTMGSSDVEIRSAADGDDSDVEPEVVESEAEETEEDKLGE